MTYSYNVVGTMRDMACDKQSSISHLILDYPYLGTRVHPVKDLYDLAFAKRLKVRLSGWAWSVNVIIYWSKEHGRWIAKTEADTTTKNNLLELPIYYNRYDSITACSI